MLLISPGRRSMCPAEQLWIKKETHAINHRLQLSKRCVVIGKRMKDISGYTIEKIREATSTTVEVVKDKEALAVVFAEQILSHVRRGNEQDKRTVIIMPVGPTGQWKRMAEIAKRDQIDLSELCIVSMDEYLMPDGVTPVPESDPFSFAAFIKQNFANEAAASCGFNMEHWIVPEPADIGAVDRTIEAWGGVDVAFAGIGLNGHVAFNEPPGPYEAWTEESFAHSPVRIQKLAASTKATNSIFGTGGNMALVPDYAVTIGMKQILGARRVHVYLDWLWHRYMLRRSLLGPATMHFPASLLQTHPNVIFTVTEEVAEAHSIEPE